MIVPNSIITPNTVKNIPANKSKKASGTPFFTAEAKSMNLTSALLKNVIIESSNPNETIINETKIKNIELTNCNLTKCEIINTNLNNVDFSSCNIENIFIDNVSLKGIIIDRYQAAYLVNMLGVNIKN